jgi:hypothetical protein
MNTKIRGLLLISLLLWCEAGCGEQEEPPVNHLVQPGIFLTKNIKSFIGFYKIEAQKQILLDYVIKHGPQGDDPTYSREELVDDILTAAHDFQICPLVLTALIRKESSFNRRAQSPTGAVGLMQLTTSGIAEVHHQLGVQGAARQETVEYWQRLIPDLYSYLTGKTWSNLSTLTPLARKEALLTDGPKNLLYGAMLLKTLLAWKGEEDPTRTLEEVYSLALERYNGEPPPKLFAYREKILMWAEELARQHLCEALRGQALRQGLMGQEEYAVLKKIDFAPRFHQQNQPQNGIEGFYLCPIVYAGYAAQLKYENLGGIAR